MLESSDDLDPKEEDDIESQPALGPTKQLGPFEGLHRKKGISHRYYNVLALHLAGKSRGEISELTGYAEATISQILAKKEVIQVRQQLLNATQQEFEALFEEVVKVVKEKLKSPNEGIQMQAVNTWLKAHGKLLPSNQQINISAEDVVFQILNQPGSKSNEAKLTRGIK